MTMLVRPTTDDIPGYLNTLFKWIEGEVKSWTPAVVFATPGDLSVAYSTQVGRYILFGPMVIFWVEIVTSTFTHTTATGDFNITGLPYSSLNVTGLTNIGAVRWSGITKANYTNINLSLGANSAILTLSASGSGVAAATVGAGDMPTGGTVILRGFGIYIKS